MKKHKIEIIHEDDAFVIVNKPANFLTIPDRFKHDLPSVSGILKERYGEIFIVHRIDRETSGILCFARTKEAHKNLSKQFQDRTVSKIYKTLVEGTVYHKTGTINKPIAESMTQRGRMVIANRGKESITEYKVVEEFKNYSLVEADIKTGRTHQVRIHFQAIGHPLAVDKLYGRKEAFLLSEVKKKYNHTRDVDERPLMSRTTLHAYQLTLNHPVTDERLVFTNELPRDFSAVMKQLRKWGK